MLATTWANKWANGLHDRHTFLPSCACAGCRVAGGSEMRPALSYAGHPRTWHDTSSPSPFSLLFIDTMHRDGARNRLCTHERHEKTPRRDASSRPVRKTRNRSYPARAARVGRVDCRKRCGHVGVLSATAWAVRREHFNLIHSSLSRGLRAYSTRLHRAYFCPGPRRRPDPRDRSSDERVSL